MMETSRITDDEVRRRLGDCIADLTELVCALGVDYRSGMIAGAILALTTIHRDWDLIQRSAH